jgi:hypothetical protein
MWEDPIVNEIRHVREDHAARFKYDLQAIYRDLKEQEQNSQRAFVKYSPRRVQPVEISELTPVEKTA